jgi:hypothetical protein
MGPRWFICGKLSRRSAKYLIKEATQESYFTSSALGSEPSASSGGVRNRLAKTSTQKVSRIE